MVVTAFTERGRDDGPNLESQEDLAYAVKSKEGGGRSNDNNIAITEPVEVFETRIGRSGRGQPSEVCPTLKGAEAGETSDMRPVIFGGGMVVRRLTPTETLRLMGLPDLWLGDDWLDIGPSLSDSAKYRMVGNSGVVQVLRWIAERIALADAKLKEMS